MAYINQLPGELLQEIFNLCPCQQNLINTQVCKHWKALASKVASSHFIEQFQKNAEPALPAGESLADCWKAYTKLVKLQNNNQHNFCSIQKEFYKSVRKYRVSSIKSVFFINLNSDIICNDRVRLIVGKIFVSFYVKSPRADLVFGDYWIRYFPTELFALVEKEKKTTFRHDKTLFCLHGDLFEFQLNSCEPKSLPMYLMDVSRLDPNKFYVPELDAKPAKLSREFFRSVGDLVERFYPRI